MSLSPGSLFWRGLLTTIIGIVALAWPGITIGAFVILFAIYAFAGGAMDCIVAFSSDRVGPVVGWLLLGLLSFAAGITALVWPSITAYALTIWIGAWALVTGIIEIGITFRAGETAGERALWLLTGVVSVLLAVSLFARPDIGAVSLATVFGLFALFYGISGIITSIAWKSRGGALV